MNPDGNSSEEHATRQPQGFEMANALAHELLRVVVRRRWILMACLFGVVALVMSRVMLAPNEYTASTTLVIQQSGPDILTFKDVMGSSSSRLYYQEFLETELSIIQSRSVLAMAVEELDLDNRPEYVNREAPVSRRVLRWVRGLMSRKETDAGPEDDGDPRSPGLAFLRGRLGVDARYSSQVVELSFVDLDPVLARDAVNSVADAYQEFTLRSRADVTGIASQFLTGEIEQIRGEIEDLESALQQMSEDRQIVALANGPTDINEQTVTELNRRHGEARARLAKAAAHFEAVNQADADALPEVRNSVLISELRAKYAEIEREHSQMAERFKEDWPQLMQLRLELDQTAQRLQLETDKITRQVRSSAEAEYRKAQAEVRNLQQELDADKQRVRQSNEDARGYRDLVAEIEGKRRILDELITRQTETAASAGLQEHGATATNVRVIDEATTPERPSGPRRLYWFVWSLMLGAGLGIGVAVAVDHLDNSVKTEEDLESSSGYPVLGLVPKFPRVSVVSGATGDHQVSPDLAGHSTPHSGFAEAFKTLRTAVLLAHPKRPPRHIVVTSARPEEGKSLLCTNLAVALAQLGKRVLLIDADLRRSRLHKVFDVPNDAGLSSFLSGNAGLSEIVHETPIPNLAIMPSGPIPPNPSELLASRALEDLLTAIEDEEPVDHVIFDASPVLTLADALVLSTAMDATILVVRAGRTSREAVRQACAQLRKSRGRVIGAVLNAVSPGLGGYYYARYYGPTDHAAGKTRFSKWPVRLVVRRPGRPRGRAKKRGRG